MEFYPETCVKFFNKGSFWNLQYISPLNMFQEQQNIYLKYGKNVFWFSWMNHSLVNGES